MFGNSDGRSDENNLEVVTNSDGQNKKNIVTSGKLWKYTFNASKSLSSYLMKIDLVLNIFILNLCLRYIHFQKIS